MAYSKNDKRKVGTFVWVLIAVIVIVAGYTVYTKHEIFVKIIMNVLKWLFRIT